MNCLYEVFNTNQTELTMSPMSSGSSSTTSSILQGN
jgi:hypothetical protein